MSAHDLPIDILQERANEQRGKLHNSLSELKSSVRGTVDERLEIKTYVGKYLWPATIVVSLVAGPGPSGKACNVATTPSSSGEDVVNLIRARAFDLYEKRGRQDRHAEEDWLQAEAEILSRAKAGA